MDKYFGVRDFPVINFQRKDQIDRRKVGSLRDSGTGLLTSASGELSKEGNKNLSRDVQKVSNEIDQAVANSINAPQDFRATQKADETLRKGIIKVEGMILNASGKAKEFMKKAVKFFKDLREEFPARDVNE
jgi:hypothetical protein